ncbi:hypothetical protein [uncultured Roseobacter sp.]|uniref:hypothetical protein n=1 Tax=uncultured Roseobacter sp. TaxID=114847 RepID=UPI002604691A|nr:hypothetical protein [uncultured Roseobacter sp.]
MTDTTIQQEIRKSNVRIFVTYFVVGLYSVSAVGITIFLMATKQTELALGVFNGLATLSAGIAGFWFGSRGSGFPNGEPGKPEDLKPEEAVVIGPENGTSHRPVHENEPALAANTIDDESPKIDLT